MNMSYVAKMICSVSCTLLLSTGSAMAQEKNVIRIGMTVSSTGSFALASQSGVRGVEVWVDEVNSRGGIDLNGKKYKVELVQRDDRSDKQMVSRVYETLITDDKVDFLFSPFGSTLTAAAATITERMNKLLVIWSASNDKLYQQGFKNMFSATQEPASHQPRPSIELAAHLGHKKIAIAYSDEPFTTAFGENAKALAEKNHLEVVMFDKYPKGQKDFSTIIQKAKALGADVFYPTSYEGDLMSMAKQLRQLNISFPLTYMFYSTTPQFQTIGKDAEYIFGSTNYHTSLNWKVNVGYDRAQLLAAYNRIHPKAAYEPDFQTLLAYSAGPIMEKVIEKAGTFTDAPAMKKAAVDLSGKLTVAAGPYAIDETGKQLEMAWAVLQQQPGKGYVAVWPEAVANAKPIDPAPAWSDRK